MTLLKYDVNDERVQFLMKTDQKLADLIRRLAPCEINLDPDGFRCIVKYIIGQQISDKARETIWLRLCCEVEEITPECLLSQNIQKFRNIGLSGRKIEYIRGLATNILSQNISFSNFPSMSNEAIIKELTSIRGVGRWTAEMYLIFSLGREDVLSKGDGTTRRAIKWMYNLNSEVSSDMLDTYFSKWMPYATIVSSFFWKATAQGLMREPFDQITFDALL